MLSVGGVGGARSGERKQLQGKFWGKRLLNPNVQVGKCMFAYTPSTHTPPSLPIALCVYVCACV